MCFKAFEVESSKQVESSKLNRPSKETMDCVCLLSLVTFCSTLHYLPLSSLPAVMASAQTVYVLKMTITGGNRPQPAVPRHGMAESRSLQAVLFSVGYFKHPHEGFIIKTFGKSFMVMGAWLGACMKWHSMELLIPVYQVFFR